MRKVWNFYAYSPDLFNYTFDMWVRSQSDSGLGCALRMIVEKEGLGVEIHNFKKTRRQEDVSEDGLRFVSHPISFRWLPSRIILNGERKVLYGYQRQASIPFLRYLFKEPPALVHLFVTDGYFSYLVTRILRRLGIPYILEFAGEDVTPTFFREKIVRRAAAIIVYTKEACSGLSYGVKERVVRIIPPGIDLTKFRPRQVSSKPPFPALLYVGQISPLKGVLQTVEILKHLKFHFPQATLRIVGRVVDERCFGEVKTCIEEWALGDSVAFTDFVDKDDLPEIYSAADIFIFPSRSEGIPQVVLEAMACGTPVAALGGTGGHNEIIDDEENGILASSENLYERVLSVLQDRERLSRMSRRAPTTVAYAYCVDNAYTSLSHLYKEILERNQNVA